MTTIVYQPDPASVDVIDDVAPRCQAISACRIRPLWMRRGQPGEGRKPRGL
jgi:hypothetical protein